MIISYYYWFILSKDELFPEPKKIIDDAEHLHS